MDKRRKWSAPVMLRNAAVCVCLGLLLYRGGQYRSGAAWYEQLQEQAEIRLPEDSSAENPEGTAAGEGHRPSSARAGAVPPVRREVLSAIGAAAWLKIGEISYPVMQAGDNAWYLHRLPDGTPHPDGSLFLQAENNPAFTDRNSIIYGHNMADGSMFGKLKRIRAENRTDLEFELYLADGTLHRYRLFSVVSTTGGSEAFAIRFPDEEAFIRYQEAMLAASVCQTGIRPAAGSRLVTLATCDGPAGTSRRLLVQGVETEVISCADQTEPVRITEEETQKQEKKDEG